ncbi:MAG: hypothetical protein QGI13_14410, partial [Rhodospirillales bacterium]|nr:hypothetical protein [Rhodospirillales bacterium]
PAETALPHSSHDNPPNGLSGTAPNFLNEKAFFGGDYITPCNNETLHNKKHDLRCQKHPKLIILVDQCHFKMP